jgi:hypothetical protein
MNARRLHTAHAVAALFAVALLLGCQDARLSSPVAATDSPLGAGPALASWAVAETEQQLAAGVSYRVLAVPTPRGSAVAHLVEVDLSQRKVSVDLLYPGVVAERRPVSAMADAQGAVAGVNGDFFNISATQPGVVPTDAPVGPAIASGRDLKAAVPTAQRFGPSLPQGATVQDVFGVGKDGVGRLDRLTLRASLRTRNATIEIDGLNQYAISEGGIGAFDWRWGTVSRQRAICGTDTRREDPCSEEVHEVTVRRGRVAETSTEPGSGSIPEDPAGAVLLGRESGAEALRQLEVGEPVHVRYELVSSAGHVPLALAVGGHPIVRDGEAVDGLNDTAAAVRSGAGVGADGRTLFLLALDRNAAGMTYAELAALLLSVGVDSGVNLDGGGSSTLVAREPGASTVTVRNLAPGDFERPVPNGIGVFVRP